MIICWHHQEKHLVAQVHIQSGAMTSTQKKQDNIITIKHDICFMHSFEEAYNLFPLDPQMFPLSHVH